MSMTLPRGRSPSAGKIGRQPGYGLQAGCGVKEGKATEAIDQ